MKIAVLGTGTVGNAIASKLIELGHSVRMGSRSATNEKAIAFVSNHPNGNASSGIFEDAATYGEIIFNCTLGIESVNILKSAGDKNLKGKIIIDVSNALDFSKGMPPLIALANDTSVGEQIQNSFPEAKVVKTLNTIWCGIMVNPQMINNGDHSVFMSGNDHDAKVRVGEILRSFGWQEKNIIDLGDITTARGPEMYLPLWLRMWGVYKKGAFNFKMVT